MQPLKLTNKDTTNDLRHRAMGRRRTQRQGANLVRKIRSKLRSYEMGLSQLHSLREQMKDIKVDFKKAHEEGRTFDKTCLKISYQTVKYALNLMHHHVSADLTEATRLNTLLGPYL